MSKKLKSYKIPQALKTILQEEEYTLYEEYFNTEASKAVREKLILMLQNKIDVNEDKHDKECKYEIPSWSEYQADAIGYRRAMRELIKILL